MYFVWLKKKINQTLSRKDFVLHVITNCQDCLVADVVLLHYLHWPVSFVFFLLWLPGQRVVSLVLQSHSCLVWCVTQLVVVLETGCMVVMVSAPMKEMLLKVRGSLMRWFSLLDHPFLYTTFNVTDNVLLTGYYNYRIDLHMKLLCSGLFVVQ